MRLHFPDVDFSAPAKIESCVYTFTKDEVVERLHVLRFVVAIVATNVNVANYNLILNYATLKLFVTRLKYLSVGKVVKVEQDKNRIL